MGPEFATVAYPIPGYYRLAGSSRQNVAFLDSSFWLVSGERSRLNRIYWKRLDVCRPHYLLCFDNREVRIS